jgi:hypothetical protein
MVLTQFFDLPNVLAEIDSNSQVSLLSEEYFVTHLKNNLKPYHFLDEPPMQFSGLGSQLTSKFPPLFLQFKIGAVLLSERFHVSKELTSSPVLIGTDVIDQYRLHFVPLNKRNWELRIGYENKILAAVPCKVVSKDARMHKVMAKCHRIDLSDELQDEVIAEPGLKVILDNKKESSMENELDFVIKSKEIPEKYKETLIDTLKEIPSLYSGKDFSEVPFPPEIYTHHIDFYQDDLKELHSKPYPISGIRAEQLKVTLDELCKNGFIERGDSSYVSPVFFILKKQNRDATASKGRLVYDYRRLNSHIKPLNHPIKNIRYFFNECSKYKLFTLIDLRNAFLSIKLTPRASERASIITLFVIYRPLRSPFGLRMSPSAFCYALSLVLKDLPFVTFYMDDIIVAALDEEDMTQKLKIVFA